MRPSPMRLARICLLPPLLAVLAGCVAPVDRAAPRRPWTGLQQLLGLDLSPAGFGARADRIARTGKALGAEFLRVPRLAAGPPALLQRAAADLARAPHRAYELTVAELHRTPRLPAGWQPFAVLDGAARRLADDLAALPVYAGLANRPLGERDDRRHRTDPHDDRPERGWWARIARRLRL